MTTTSKKAAPTKAPPSKKAPAKTAPSKAAPAAAEPKATEERTPVKLGVLHLAARIHEKLPMVAASTVDRITQAVFDEMAAAYAAGDIVNIKDFGRLQIVHRPARTARNPATGETVDVPAKSVPKFTFAKKLKDLV